MKLNRTGSNWTELERNKINENWDIIEGNHNKLEGEFNDVVGKITDEVVGHLIDSARLDWKEPVDTVGDLPANAEVGETRMVREADPDGISYVYRYDGEKWEKIQAIDVTLVNEVDRRLTRQLAHIAYQLPSNSTADDLQNIINNAKNGSTIMFEKGGTYTFDKEIKFLPQQKNIAIDGRGSTVNFTHGGDGFVVESENQNYGSHILQNMLIYGGNERYPQDSGYIPTNNGAGIRMRKSYYGVVRDCAVEGFKYGLYLDTGIKNNIEGKSYFRFNQYGVYIVGGATNMNNFKGVSVRENRKVGVTITKGTETVYPTHNVFEGCLIESNIPYPYLTGGNAPSDSVGVYLDGVYNNIFLDCYLENHQYAIYLTGSTDANTFQNCRFNSSADRSRVDMIFFNGSGLANNTFINCYNSTPINIINVDWDSASISKTQFIDCAGFTFRDFMSTNFDIINLKTNQSGNGDFFKSLSLPQEQLKNPVEGTANGRIQGIGTSSAILRVQGYGEVEFGTAITAPTTITEIQGLRRGQLLFIHNYQETNPVTIKSTSRGTSGIVLKEKKDVVLREYGDILVLYQTMIGRLVEVGRNIHTSIVSASKTVNSSPDHVGQIMIDNNGAVYIAHGTSYGAWTKVSNN